MKKVAVSHQLAAGILGVVLVVSGCQTAPTAKQAAAVDNMGFMSLWETYSDCRIASDLSQASSNVKRLTAAAQLHTASEGFVLPLPTKLERLVTSPSKRFAVDVHAMAAACSLRTGQMALERGRPDMARDLFASVISLQPETSSYYAVQARAFLTELDRGIDISLNIP